MRRKIHNWLGRKLTGKKHSLFVNGIVVAVATYATLQKTLGVSVGAYAQSILQPAAYCYLKVILLAIVIYTCLAKIAWLILESYPASLTKTQEPEKINECVLVINEEIKRHIKEIDHNKVEAAKTFVKSHNFNVNIAHIVSCLADHLKRAFPTLRVRNRDIFISVYEYNDQRNTLDYITHWNPSRDAVFSKTIEVSNLQFRSYECVKCINSNNVTSLKWNCFDYAKTNNNRGNIKHYIGFKIESVGKTTWLCEHRIP